MAIFIIIILVFTNAPEVVGGHWWSKVASGGQRGAHQLEHNWWPKVATRSIINIITLNISITIAPHHHNYQYQAKNSIVQ